MKFSINLYPQAGRPRRPQRSCVFFYLTSLDFLLHRNCRHRRLLMWRLLIFILFKLKQITSFLVNSSALHPINSSTLQPINSSTLQLINSSTHQLINSSTHQSLPSGRAGLVVHNAAAPSSISLRSISGFAGTEEAKATFVATDVVFKKIEHLAASDEVSEFLNSCILHSFYVVKQESGNLFFKNHK